MKTNNIQTSNSLSFGAKLQISRRTCVRGKKFIDKELTNQYFKKAEGIGTSKDSIKFDIEPLYKNDDKHIYAVSHGKAQDYHQRHGSDTRGATYQINLFVVRLP